MEPITTAAAFASIISGLVSVWQAWRSYSAEQRRAVTEMLTQPLAPAYIKVGYKANTLQTQYKGFARAA